MAPQQLGPRSLLAAALCVALAATGPVWADAPAGQTTSPGLLPAAASTEGTGWSPYAGAGITQAAAGRTDTAALTIRSAGARTGAVSSAVAATPGSRYVADGWARAASTAQSLALGLQFRDSAGALLDVATQTGQGLLDSPAAWSALAPVVGFAPPTAATVSVVVLDVDGPAGDVQWVDDVQVREIAGSPAALTAPLTTSGARILDGAGRSVRLTGVYLAGLETSSKGSVTTGEITVARSWGANLVRVGLGQNYALPGDCLYDSGYLPRVDALVRQATNAGLAILLDLHTLAALPCTAPRPQSMPDAKSLTFWRLLAQRYASNPLVAFDLFNEPHDITDAVWRNGGMVLSGGARYQSPGMQALYDAIRASGASNLVFASGPNWAASFPAAAPLTGTRNLVYAAHAYTCPRGTPESGAKCSTGPDGTVHDPRAILSRFDGPATRVPIVLTEFGYPSRNEGQYTSRAIAYVGEHGWAGWSAFTFDNGTTGMFSLWKNATGDINPTVSGMPVMLGLSTN